MIMTGTEVELKAADWLPGLREAGGVEGVNIRLMNLAIASNNPFVYALILASAMWMLKGQVAK